MPGRLRAAYIGKIPENTGASATVSVKSFGGVGDGVTDNTAAIAAAENAIAATGGRIFFPAGIYLTGPQKIDSNVVWEGEGPGSTVIRLKAGSNADLLQTRDYATLTGTNPTANQPRGQRGHGLRHLTLDANRTAQTSRSRCYATYGWNHTVEDVWFLNGFGIGVSSEWVASDGGTDHMEALWTKFKIWNYGGVAGGAIGLDWSGPHDSMIGECIVGTLDSTIRPYHATYGATPINAGAGNVAVTPADSATTFTFTTTGAANAGLFPETGGSFLLPVDSGKSHFITVVYTSAATVGAVTTFSGCTVPSTSTGRTIGTSAPNVGIVQPTYGILLNRVQRGEYALVIDRVHIWGRNHIGISGNTLKPPYNLDATLSMANSHCEGAFLANVIMGPNSSYIGGSVYGTNGQVGNEYEVGIMLSVDNRGGESVAVDTVLFALGKAGGPAGCAPIVNVNSAQYFLRARGTTLTAEFFRSGGPIYNQQSDVLVVCRNQPALSMQWFGRSLAPAFNGGLQLGAVQATTTGPKLFGGDTAPPTNIPGTVGDFYLRKATGAVSGGAIYRATAVTGGLITAWSSATSDDSRRNLAGGRMPVATRMADNAAAIQGGQNTPMMGRVRHVAAVQCTDVRLVYGCPLAAESDGALQPFTIKVGLEYNGVTYPVTFSGRKNVTIDPGGVAVISDPVAVELPAGAVFYTRPYSTSPSGSTTLAAAASVGDATLTLTAKLGGNTSRGYIGETVIEAGGGTRELVEIIDWSGSGPYVATLRSVLTSAHNNGTVVGGTIAINVTTRSDWGEANVTSNTDNSWTTAALAVPGNSTFTLAAAANIGDTSVQLTAIGAGIGPTITVAAVTYTIRSVFGTANPYTIYLTSPITTGAASGATVTGSIGTGIAVAPTAIVADTVIGTPPAPVIVIGDSIPSGVGQSTIYPASSYFSLAADAAARPYIRTSKSGEAAYQYVDPTVSRRRRDLLSMAKWAFFEYGVNDIYGGRTYNQMVADATTILGLARERGLKCAVSTLTPRTTSTDNFLTVGNQTVAAAGFNTVRIAYNAWVRLGCDGLADLVVEMADATETARDSGLWKADASGPYTVDGIHPSNAGALLMKPTMDAALAVML